MANDPKASAPANMDVQVDYLDGSDKNDPSLIIALLSITKSVRNLMGLKLSELDIHSGQDEMLMALNADAPMAVSHLSSIIAVRPSTTSKMLDVLEAKGLVQRSAHKTDARRTLVHLTRLGVGRQGQVREIWRRLHKELLVDPDPALTLRHLQRIDQLLVDRLSRLR